MAIRLSWPSQASKGLTGIEIYRKLGWDATLDVLNPGTPIATLAADAVEFVDVASNLVEKSTYTYWIAAVKNSERLFSAPVIQGFFLDTGPGPQTLKRGDWAAGYFGTLTKTEFFNTAELKLLLSAQQASKLVYDPANWHKFVYRGRIVYFPSSAHSFSNTIGELYARGMVYGTDDNGKVVPSGQSPTLQNCKVTKDGRTYRIRLPYAVPPDAAIGSVDYLNGEWCNTMGRLFVTTNNNHALQGLGILDSLPLIGSSSTVNDSGSALSAPMNSTTSVYYSRGDLPMGINTTSHTSSSTTWFAFELILP